MDKNCSNIIFKKSCVDDCLWNDGVCENISPVLLTKTPIIKNYIVSNRFFTKPSSYNTSSCTMYCPTSVPAGYYSDLKDYRSYCKCTSTQAPSRYQTCQHSLIWDLWC